MRRLFKVVLDPDQEAVVHNVVAPEEVRVPGDLSDKPAPLCAQLQADRCKVLVFQHVNVLRAFALGWKLAI